jgi:predicted amidophosphoribosyltransferase
MAVCTSCGSGVEESASFCTSCGKPMPAAVQPTAAVTVARPVCSSCGAEGDSDSAFCTECGTKLNAQLPKVAEAFPALVAAASPPNAVEAGPAMPSPAASCTSCGSSLQPGTTFCTNCGQPVGASRPSALTSEPAIAVTAPNSIAEDIPRKTAEPPAASVFKEPTIVTAPPQPAEIAPAPISIKTRVVPAAAEPSTDRDPVGPAPQLATPAYARPSDYPTAQPGGGAFRIIVVVLLLLIVVGGAGGWYFLGIETVIVCSPPDVTVFLDDKELAPTSYGRYVIPHLSRQPHLLRVQRAGFADTIERLDFPMTSLHEWVNVKLVPRRSIPASTRH